MVENNNYHGVGFFWGGAAMYERGILVPQSGIELMLPTVEAQS